MRHSKLKPIPGALLLAVLAAGCDSGNNNDQNLQGATNTPATISTTGSHNPLLLALTDGGEVLRFSADTPADSKSAQLSGEAHDGSESPFPVAMDYRPSVAPASGLFVLYSDGRLYTAQGSGTLTLVGRAAPASGSRLASMDFDPATDQIRALSDQSDAGNYRISPSTGALIATDSALAYATGDSNAGKAPGVADVAYTGAAGASSTAYILDTTQDVLARLGSTGGSPDSASSGKLSTIGAFGVDIGGGGAVGFDIPSGDSTVGYVSNGGVGASGADTDLYKIDLLTGHLTKFATISGKHVVDIALVTGTGNGTTPPVTPPPTTPPPAQLGVSPGDGLCTLALAGTGFTATVGDADVGCLDCSLTDEGNLIDTDFSNHATAVLTGLLLSTVNVTVAATTGTFTPAAAAVAGGVFSIPGGDPGELALLPGVTLETLDASGAVVESGSSGPELLGDLMGNGVIVEGDKFAVTIPVTKPFSAIRFTFDGGLLGVNTTINSYYACASATAAGSFPGLGLPL